MFDISNQWLLFAFDVSAKSLLLAIVAGVAMKLLRIRDSNLKHRVWSGVLVGMLALPLLSYLLPTIPVSVPQNWTEVEVVEHSPETTATKADSYVQPSQSPAPIEPLEPTTVGRTERSEVPATATEPITPGPAQVVSTSTKPEPTTATSTPWTTADYLRIGSITLLISWLSVTAFFSLRLLAGLLTGWRLRNRANVVTDEVALLVGDVVDEATSPNRSSKVRGLVACIVAKVVKTFGLSRANAPKVLTTSATVRESTETCVPVTVGLFRPTVLLPTEWRTWPLEKLQAIIAHELTHVVRRDFLVTLAAEFNQCLYWFHPVSWWLKKQLSDLAEEVCDDAAIGQSGDRTGYARHLLEVAAQVSESNGRVIQPGLAMARRSNVESRISTILDFKRPLSQRLSIRTAALVVLVTIPLVTTAAAIRAVVPENEAEPVLSDEEPANAKSEAAADKSDEDVRVHGQVVDAHGKPMPNATVRLYGNFTPGYYASPDDFNLVKTLKLDDEGRFDETFPIDSLIRELSKAPRGKWNKLAYSHQGPWSTLVVSAPGHGHEFVLGTRVGRKFDGVQKWMPSFMAGPVTVTLKKAQPIRGRLVGLEGQPIPNAVVSVYKLAHHDPARFGDWLKRVPNKPKYIGASGMRFYGTRPKNEPDFPAINTFEVPPDCVADVRTDRNGRFELKDIVAPNDALVLRVRGKGVVDRLVHVVARSMKPVYCHGLLRTMNETAFHGSEFDYVTQTSVPVIGVVRDIETKEPLPNVAIQTIRIDGFNGSKGYITTRSDAKGQFRIEGLPVVAKGSSPNQISVQPVGLPYIPNDFVNVPHSDGREPIECNVEFRRAVLAKGRITEKGTGKPVAADVYYAPFRTNENHASYAIYTTRIRKLYGNGSGYRSDKDGRFEIPVIPGRGVIAAIVRNSTYVNSYGVDSIPEFAEAGKRDFGDLTVYGHITPSLFQSLKAVEVPTGTESIDVELEVDPGITATVHFVGPDGKPLADVRGSGLAGRRWSDSLSATAKVPGLAFGKIRPIYVMDTDRKLFRLAQLTPKPGETEFTVQLMPPTRVTGRIVDTEDRPVSDASLRADHDNDPDFGGTMAMEKTDDAGKFEFELPVGSAYNISLGTRSAKFFTVVKGLDNSAPKRVDLGDIVLDETAKQWSVLKAKQEPKVSETAQPASESTPDTTSKQAGGKPVHTRGQVFGADGKPANKAKVQLWCFVPEHAEHSRYKIADLQVDASGRFDEKIARSLIPIGVGNQFPVLVISAPGHAVKMFYESYSKLSRGGVPKSLDFMTKPLEVRLAKAESVRGRLLTVEGQPVVGAVVNVRRIGAADPATLPGWLSQASTVRPMGDRRLVHTDDTAISGPTFPGEAFRLPSTLVPPVRTDASGRFEIPSLVTTDSVVELAIREPSIVTDSIHMLTRPMKTVYARLPSHFAMLRGAYHGQDFDYVTSPSVPVVGVVRDIETKQPFPNLTVSVNSAYGTRIKDYYPFRSVKTDAKGRYRIEGLPIPPKGTDRHGGNTIKVAIGDLPYIENEHWFVPAGDGTQPVEFNIEMRRAVMAKGRITNEAGQPIVADVVYAPFQTNRNNRSYAQFSNGNRSIATNNMRFRSDHNGEFEIPVIPGRGVIAVRTGSRAHTAAFGVEKIKEFADKKAVRFGRVTESYDIRPSRFNSLQEVNIPEGVKEFDIVMKVQTGRTITVRFIGPDGKPLSGVGGRGFASNRDFIRSKDPFIKATGFTPGLTRELSLWTNDRKLQRLFQITPRDDQTEFTVQLLPLTHVKGRFIDPEGHPIPGVRVSARHLFAGMGYGESQRTSDKNGRFDCPLPVGATFEIRCESPKTFWVLKDYDNSKPSNVDLGELVLDTEAKSFTLLKPKRKAVITEIPIAATN